MGKNSIWDMPKPDFQDIIKRYSSLASGATLVHPNTFPSELKSVGIGYRNSSTNDFWGSIITRPSKNELIYGLVYFDHTEDKPNEDTYVLDLNTQKLEYFTGSKYEKVNPAWKGNHKGLKDFLRP